ncbi:MAG: DNA replication and repair protein RecF [Gemmatimonadota bacterium]|nr:DNA replication and repair protein RecF [Gemmatimonadota bacterium]
MNHAAPPGVWLRRLEIQDFRNLERVSLDLPREGIAVVGDNGHGKTNLLEAITYLQTLRSVRGARDSDLTRFGAAGFHLSAEALTPGEHELDLGFELATKKKKLLHDGVAPPRLSDGLGALPSVIFSPRDVELVGGSASERRRFLDLILALTSRQYLHALQRYRGALSQRNSALRNAAKSRSGDESIAIWEPTLAENGAIVIEERARWVESSRGEYASLCARIGERGEATMRYHTAFSLGPSLVADLADELAAKRAADVRRGMTSVGPHRDDLLLTLDGQPLRVFGSAGQHRTAAIALRILEGATLKRAAGAEPILLFDDPFAELDAGRAERILDLIQESGRGQTILVVPRETDIPAELMKLARFKISLGVIEREAA